MTKDFLASSDFLAINKKHCHEMIETLLENNIYFYVIAGSDFITFSPKLPPELDAMYSTQKYIIFGLYDYTFTSIKLDKNTMSFHAGFGEENYESIVSIELNAIKQIKINNDIIFVNNAIFTKSPKQKSIENILKYNKLK